MAHTDIQQTSIEDQKKKIDLMQAKGERKEIIYEFKLDHITVCTLKP